MRRCSFAVYILIGYFGATQRSTGDYGEEGLAGGEKVSIVEEKVEKIWEIGEKIGEDIEEIQQIMEACKENRDCIGGCCRHTRKEGMHQDMFLRFYLSSWM